MKEVLIAVSGIIFFLIGMIRLSSAVRKMINVRIKEYVKYAVERPFFYFGLIFFGLELVSQAVAPLKETPAFVNIFSQTKSPLFGIGLGMVVTAVVQASAIPISILALLAQQDLINLENALPVVMGANIGTTVTALLAGTVANINGKRSAAAQLIFKCTGVLICLMLMPFLMTLLKDLSPSTAQQIALGHLFINLVIVFVFIFLLKPFASLMQKMLPGEEEALPVWPEYINTKDAANPYRALDSVQKELQRQAALVLRMFTETQGLLKDYQEVKRKNVAYVGMVVNNLRAQIMKFLLKVSARQLSAHHSKRLFVYTAMAGDIESMGTHVNALGRLTAQRLWETFPSATVAKKN